MTLPAFVYVFLVESSFFRFVPVKVSNHINSDYRSLRLFGCWNMSSAMRGVERAVAEQNADSQQPFLRLCHDSGTLAFCFSLPCSGH